MDEWTVVQIHRDKLQEQCERKERKVLFKSFSGF